MFWAVCCHVWDYEALPGPAEASRELAAGSQVPNYQPADPPGIGAGLLALQSSERKRKRREKRERENERTRERDLFRIAFVTFGLGELEGRQRSAAFSWKGVLGRAWGCRDIGGFSSISRLFRVLCCLMPSSKASFSGGFFGCSRPGAQRGEI